MSAEQIAQAWDHYVEMLRRYELAKKASDTAEAMYAGAYRVVETAHAAEVRWARAVQQASRTFQAATNLVCLELLLEKHLSGTETQQREQE